MYSNNNISDKEKVKNNKIKSNINIINENEMNMSLNMNLNEETIDLPILKPISEKDKDILKYEPEYKMKEKNNNYKNNKRENINNNISQDIDEDLLQYLLEDTEKDKDKDKNLQNLSLEVLFDTELKKKFYELNPKNSRIKMIKDILYTIKTKDIKNYNPRINGPYLVGSYLAIPELPCLNYLSPIDIMYTYKDILIDKKIRDYTINNIIKDILILNIMEIYEIFDDDNKITKIRIKCNSEMNLILFFNVYFVDIGYDYNEKIINNIIFNSEKMVFKNKEEEKNFINIMLYLRIWRKKNKLYFIIPELLDEIAKKYFEPKNTIALVIVNVFYDLYNGINDFNYKRNQGFLPKHKLLIENLFKQLFDDEKKSNAIKMAALETNTLLSKRNISALFDISEDD